MAPNDTAARFISPAYPVSNVSESAMTENVSPMVSTVTSESTISWRSRITPTIMAAPAMAAVRTDGTRERSRVRWMEEPRRRSCGSTISTTKRVTIGSEIRKLLAQLQVFGK